jgi:hypothetical protein
MDDKNMGTEMQFLLHFPVIHFLQKRGIQTGSMNHETHQTHEKPDLKKEAIRFRDSFRVVRVFRGFPVRFCKSVTTGKP